jgi:DNA-3-methyladenine glycosylase II
MTQPGARRELGHGIGKGELGCGELGHGELGNSASWVARPAPRVVATPPASRHGRYTSPRLKGARAAADHLRSCDPRMATLVERIGPLRLRPQSCSHFESLARAIVYQQLSGKAAATIFGRIAALSGGDVSPTVVSRLRDDSLRQAGLSGQKLSYLRDLSARVLQRSLDLERLPGMPDEEVVSELIAVKGIGRWSAEMFLIFRLGRPDVLPVGDLGVRRAVQKTYRLRKLPEPQRLAEIGEPWRPWRTAASWYLWRSLGQEALI